MRLAVQLPRYVAVSALALAVDFTSFLALARAGLDPTLAGALGYAVGLLVHYGLSRRFVFVSASPKTERRLVVEFAVTGLAGIAITAAVIALAHDVFGLGAVAAKVIAVVVSFLAVFALRRQFVFAPSQRPAE